MPKQCRMVAIDVLISYEYQCNHAKMYFGRDYSIVELHASALLCCHKNSLGAAYGFGFNNFNLYVSYE